MVLSKSLQRWSKEKQKTEKIIPEQSDSTDNLIVHEPNKNTYRCILKENLEGLVLSEDSPLGKTVLKMDQQFVLCLEELSMRKGEVKELQFLIQRCNINMSFFLNQAAIMYRNHVKSLRENGDCKRKPQENIGDITAEKIPLKKVQCYQYLNKDLQHISNKKLNVANEVLATKEDSEYHLKKNYSFLHKQLQVNTITHCVIPLCQY